MSTKNHRNELLIGLGTAVALDLELPQDVIDSHVLPKLDSAQADMTDWSVRSIDRVVRDVVYNVAADYHWLPMVEIEYMAARPNPVGA